MIDIALKELVKVYPSHADADAQVRDLLGEIDTRFDIITEIVNLNPTVTVHWNSPADHAHTFISADYIDPNEGIDEESEEYDWNVINSDYVGYWISS